MPKLAPMITRKTLRRWHLWLGWLVGVPMLLWTLSGVVMVWKPIEEVRGEALLREPPPIQLSTPAIPPRLEGLDVESLALEPRTAGPRWIITTTDGRSRQADPATGGLVPTLGAADAVREVTARYTGQAKVAGVGKIDPAHPPLDLRREMDGWAVTMDDGTHFYVDSGSGEVVARRTRFWRFYDFMWGLHIMDLQTREDTHNPWILVFGLLALVTTVMAIILLPLSSRKKRKASAKPRQ